MTLFARPLQHGPPTTSKEVPTLEAFAPRFVDGHARANRHKPSGIATVESILKWHLIPTLGPKRLDAITDEQVQRLKLALSERAPKTVNNVLTVLSTLLKKAVDWGELSGHADLSTTQRYMHLSPAATEGCSTGANPGSNRSRTLEIFWTRTRDAMRGGQRIRRKNGVGLPSVARVTLSNSPPSRFALRWAPFA